MQFFKKSFKKFLQPSKNQFMTHCWVLVYNLGNTALETQAKLLNYVSE